jgi:ATP-dependent Clp protease ATP-binding subunit ClpA
MVDSYTDRVRLTLALAGTIAKDRRSKRVDPEHILHGLLLDASGEAARVLRRLGVDPADLHVELEESLPAAPALPLGEAAEGVMSRARESMERLGEDRLGSADLLIGLLEGTSGIASRILREAGIGEEKVRGELVAMRRGRAGPVGSKEAPVPEILCSARLGLTGIRQVVRLRSREETLGALGERLARRHEDLLVSYLTLAVGDPVRAHEIEVRFLNPDRLSDALPPDRQALTVIGAEEVGLRWTAVRRA